MGFWEWKESFLQEQENPWEPFNDLALPGRQGWTTHFLPYHHEIILQVAAHGDRGDVFNPQGTALVSTNAGLQSSNPAEPPQLSTGLYLFQHSLVSVGLAEL